MTGLLSRADARPVHFVGIGGAGMSALAELFVRRGIAVTGCDANPAGAADVVALGVPVASGHDPAHVVAARAVVYSSAIPLDHPELASARAAGLPVIRRAEALAEAVRGGRVVGIAGTHGKSTTTVMTTEALAAAGEDPTGLVGGRVAAWQGNLRRGGAGIFVVEADEYDRSFLALDPEVAVVTNIEADHLDIYRDLADVKATFAQYVARARYLIVCADDPGADALPSPPSAEVVRYGLDAANARLVARDVRVESGTTTFSAWFDGAQAGDVHLQLPGVHNVRNALAALAVGLVWGKKVDAMAPGLAAMAGVERRFQRLGESRGVAVVDDYAHHPTEIRATLAAARTAFPGRRIVIAFQPHLFTRTRDFADDFGHALAGADLVFVTEIYAARESPIDGVTSALVVDAARGAGANVSWRGERTALADALINVVRPGDVVLTVGAGDVTRTGGELLARLGGV
jgi:UDP-N-acetylmuramate--alanine ligase